METAIANNLKAGEKNISSGEYSAFKDKMEKFGLIVAEGKNINILDQAYAANEFLKPIFDNLGKSDGDLRGWEDSLDNGRVASVSLRMGDEGVEAMRGMGLYLSQEGLGSAEVGLDCVLSRQNGMVIGEKFKECDSVFVKLDGHGDGNWECYLGMSFFWKQGGGCIDKTVQGKGKELKLGLNNLYNALDSNRELNSAILTILKKKK